MQKIPLRADRWRTPNIKGHDQSSRKKIAEKSQGHLRKMFAEMLVSPVIHTDCTNVRVNGKTAYAYVCSTPKADVMYFARKHKGHDGVKGTVVEDYEGTLVHDHEMTFYSYGSKHQECNVHILRYLKDSMDNEPELTWNSEISFTSLEELCCGMSMLASIRQKNGANVFLECAELFNS